MASRLKPGAIIAGRYRLDKPLGEGGIGVVWEGWQTGIERRVAIKFLKVESDDELRTRFEREAQALGRLNHPNCVTVFDFGYTDNGTAFLVMEYLEGEPANEWRRQSLTIRDIVEIGQQISTALAYAHHQGVVHRDLKPENVFAVDTFRGGRQLKVLDFGLAKLTGRQPEDITKTGHVFGTPAYMSPEQLRGTRDVGPATDLYALGIMLFELIEGKLPFWHDSPFRLGIAHIQDPIPPMSRANCGEQLKNIVRTLLAKNPEERYPSALDVYDALEAVEATGADSTMQLVRAEPPRQTLSRLPSDFALPSSTAEVSPRTGPIPTAEIHGADTEHEVVDSTLEKPVRVEQQSAFADVDDLNDLVPRREEIAPRRPHHESSPTDSMRFDEIEPRRRGVPVVALLVLLVTTGIAIVMAIALVKQSGEPTAPATNDPTAALPGTTDPADDVPSKEDEVAVGTVVDKAGAAAAAKEDERNRGAGADEEFDSRMIVDSTTGDSTDEARQTEPETRKPEARERKKRPKPKRKPEPESKPETQVEESPESDDDGTERTGYGEIERAKSLGSSQSESFGVGLDSPRTIKDD